jgi:hypothetical protein
MTLMKKSIQLLSIAAFLVVGLQEGNAQSACADYHKFNCQRAADKSWSLNGQSKSASVQIGRETELNVIIYRGQDYRISVCQDTRLLGEQIAIRIVEKVRVPRVKVEEKTEMEEIRDEQGNLTGATQEVKTKTTESLFDEVEKVLWDNTEHDMIQEVEFSCAATKRIAIKINALGPTESKGRKQMDIGCVGILIEHMVTPGLGF